MRKTERLSRKSKLNYNNSLRPVTAVTSFSINARFIRKSHKIIHSAVGRQHRRTKHRKIFT